MPFGEKRMRKFIDAHVHITPEGQIGRKNGFGGTYQAYGYLDRPEGGFYTMPPFIHDTQFTADTLVRVMDVYGVEKAVIQQTMMNPLNEEVARAVKKYPDRLSGAMLLDYTQSWPEQMDRWQEAGLRSIKFEMRSYTDPGCFPEARCNDERMMRIFEEAGRRNLTVTIDPGPTYLEAYKPEALEEAVSTFPGTRFVICHIAYPMPLETPEQQRLWEQMLQISRHENCWLDVSAMPDFFDAEGWPYPTALKILKQAKETAGSRYLIWGSDITGTLLRATYPQMQEMFARAECLSEEELSLLYYENARDAYQI